MMWLDQLSQYLRWVYPALMFFVIQPLAIIGTVWVTTKINQRQFDKWMHLHGPAELKRRISDYQNKCAEHRREIARLERENGALRACLRGATIATAHAAQALEGIQLLGEQSNQKSNQ